MKISVSGKTYFAALDPNATAVPAESGWPVPRFRRFGNGVQVSYEVDTIAVARDIAEHLDTMGECFTAGSDDPFSRAEGRACYRDAARIRLAIDAYIEDIERAAT